MDQVDRLVVPRFSLAERDRRWRLVRRLGNRPAKAIEIQ